MRRVLVSLLGVLAFSGCSEQVEDVALTCESAGYSGAEDGELREPAVDASPSSPPRAPAAPATLISRRNGRRIPEPLTRVVW